MTEHYAHPRYPENRILVNLTVELPTEYARHLYWATLEPNEHWVIAAKWHTLLGPLLSLIYAQQEGVTLTEEYIERMAGMQPWPAESE
jgi:hypothetical protein